MSSIFKVEVTANLELVIVKIAVVEPRTGIYNLQYIPAQEIRFPTSESTVLSYLNEATGEFRIQGFIHCYSPKPLTKVAIQEAILKFCDRHLNHKEFVDHISYWASERTDEISRLIQEVINSFKALKIRANYVQ